MVKLLVALAAASLLLGVPNGSLNLAPAAQSTSEESSKQAQPNTPKRIRVGGQSMRRMVIYEVTPKYPEGAKKQGIQGTVRLAVVIGQDGSIQDLKVTSGDPVLADSALTAVKKWRYKPTFLNGRPVEVETEIT